MAKLTVGVIFGGQSSEHEISCVSATSVIRNLDKDKYDIITIGITKKGEWYVYGGSEDNIENGLWKEDEKNLTKAVVSASSADHGIIVFDKERGVYVKKIDVFFPVLHGMYGEDGTIQGLFEMSGAAYVGCGVLASSVAMNKIYTKIIFEKAGLLQAKWTAVYSSQLENMKECVKQIEDKLSYPIYVKPANAGSSVGISRAENANELARALKNAAVHDRSIVCEEEVRGREVECAVLGNDEVFAAEVGEIVAPGSGFYDYDEKYKKNTTRLIIPADLDKETYEKVRSDAVRAFRAIDGCGVSRVDFFVRESDKKVVINEINTLPGFTSISMYPKLWAAAGKDYKTLLDEMIYLAQCRKK